MIPRIAALWLVVSLGAAVAHADASRLRIATYNVELTRDGPGLALRDIQSEGDPQVAALVEVISTIRPDILALQGIDFDYKLETLNAFADALEQSGLSYDHRFALPTNRGLQTELDLDGDGRHGGPSDAQGFGRFYGQGAMAILSSFPILVDDFRDFSALLWRDLPMAQIPLTSTGGLFPSTEALDIQRLSSSGHWIVPVEVASGVVINLMTFHASPPVFDGPEDRNGLRNADEILFWDHLLAGRLSESPTEPFVLAGSATLDPQDSDGRHVAIETLLTHPQLQDVAPTSKGARAAPDEGHEGDNALDTVDWPRVGRLRVDYVLPSVELQVLDSGVYWPNEGEDGFSAVLAASRHRLVWVDLKRPD